MPAPEQALTATVFTATPDTSVSEVACLMLHRGIGDVVVVEDLKPVGILTDRDIVVRVTAAGLDAKDVPVRLVMSKPVVAISRNEEVDKAIALMGRHGVRRLPIVDEAGRLVSILTMDDVILLSLDGCPELGEVLKRQLQPEGTERAKGSVQAQSPDALKAPTKPERFISSKPVAVVARKAVLVPVPTVPPPTGFQAVRAWSHRNRLWIVVLVVLVALGIGGTLLSNYYGRAFYQYNPSIYEPKDVDREIQRLQGLKREGEESLKGR